MEREEELLLACRACNFQLVKQHVENGVDIHYKNSACLASTINGNGTDREKIAIVEFLLDQHAKMNNTQDTLLTLAIRADNLQLVKYFINTGISPNLDGGSGILNAIINKKTEILLYLMKAGGVITSDMMSDIKEYGFDIPRCLYQVSFLQEYMNTHQPTAPNHSVINITYVYHHVEPCDLFSTKLLGSDIETP